MSEPETIELRRYPSRKLYNKNSSSYVRLPEVAEMVRKGANVRVEDTETGEDVTRAVLLQIIMEQEGHATGAMLSLFEVPVAVLNERLGLSRVKATLLTVGMLVLVGAPAALSNSTMSDFKVFDKTMFDLYDYATSNILLPVGGLFLSLFVGWVWGHDQVQRALSNDGALRNERVIGAFFGVVKFVTPLLVTLVLLDGLNII